MKLCMNQRNHLVSKDQQAWSMFVERERINWSLICFSKLHLRSSLTFDALMHFCVKFCHDINIHTLNIVHMIDKITPSSIGNQYMVMLCFIVRIRSEGVFIDWSVDTCRIIVINVYWSIYLMDLIVNNNRPNITNKRNPWSFGADMIMLFNQR